MKGAVDQSLGFDRQGKQNMQDLIATIIEHERAQRDTDLAAKKVALEEAFAEIIGQDLFTHIKEHVSKKRVELDLPDSFWIEFECDHPATGPFVLDGEYDALGHSHLRLRQDDNLLYFYDLAELRHHLYVLSQLRSGPPPYRIGIRNSKRQD